MVTLYALIERSPIQWLAVHLIECIRAWQTLPHSCFEGTYRVFARSIHDLGRCEKCTEGHYCDWGGHWSLGVEAPRPCLNGTFQNIAGSQNASDCKACPASYYCPTVATKTPLKCPEAFSSQAGATRCTKSVTEACAHVTQLLCACTAVWAQDAKQKTIAHIRHVLCRTVQICK